MNYPRNVQIVAWRASLGVWLVSAQLGCGPDQQHLAQTKRSLVETTRKLAQLDAGLQVAEREIEAQTEKLERVPGTLDLQVSFECDGQPIELERQYDLGTATLDFRSLRYWLSNVALQNAQGEWVEIPDSYFLMEHTTRPDDPRADFPTYVPRLRDKISLRNVPTGTYHALKFEIGVDPVHNNDLTIPGGELNALSNMASSEWMWFTSYIFTTLYGYYSPQPPLESGKPVLIYWATGANPDLRAVELALPSAVDVGFERQATIQVALDAAKLFDGLRDKILADGAGPQDTPTTNIGPSDDPQWTTQISNNWAAAFSARSACCTTDP
jgi:hypothetical protein